MTKNYEELNANRLMPEAKKRVAVYCRVSTDREDQANSFENQQRYFRQYIEREPNWELVDVFADEAVIIGLKTLRLIKCQKHGAF